MRWERRKVTRYIFIANIWSFGFQYIPQVSWECFRMCVLLPKPNVNVKMILFICHTQLNYVICLFFRTEAISSPTSPSNWQNHKSRSHIFLGWVFISFDFSRIDVLEIAILNCICMGMLNFLRRRCCCCYYHSAATFDILT